MNEDLVQPRTETDKPLCDHPVVEKSIGQIAFEAYRNEIKSNMPTWQWDGLDESLRRSFDAAAKAVLRIALGEHHICAPVGSDGPGCGVCARCVAETRDAENWFLRERIKELEAYLPTSGDRTTTAEQKTVVEP
jgi:hypothetical protein